MTNYFRQCYTNEYILLLGDLPSEGVDSRTTYMGSIDGSTPYGDIIGVGPVTNFINAAGVLTRLCINSGPFDFANESAISSPGIAWVSKGEP